MSSTKKRRTKSAQMGLPWRLKKHKGSIAAYSDIVNAKGNPICCVHDDYATLIVQAVNSFVGGVASLAVQKEVEPDPDSDYCEHDIAPAYACQICRKGEGGDTWDDRDTGY